MNAYAVFFLVTLAIGGVAWVFIYPYISGEKKTERRMASVSRATPMAARPTRQASKSRREQIEGTLKDLEERSRKAKRPPLSVRISQAGLDWSKRRFFVTMGIFAAVTFVLMSLSRIGAVPALAFAFAAGCGLPFWMLGFLKKRREGNSSILFRMPSTSLFAASKPACRSSTALS